MEFKVNNRHAFSAAIIFLYLVPVIFFASYSIQQMSRSKSWFILSIGLILIIFGSLVLILLLYYWEQVIKDTLQQEPQLLTYQQAKPMLYLAEKETAKVMAIDPHLTLAEEPPLTLPADKDHNKELQTLEKTLEDYQSQQTTLEAELEIKRQEMRDLEEKNQQLLLKANQTAQDFTDYKVFSEEQLKQKNLQLTTYQQTIETQRIELEKSQEKIQQLEAKVHDLSYEIKTLVHLHESDATSFPSALKQPSEKFTLASAPYKETPEVKNFFPPPYSLEPEKPTLMTSTMTCMSMDEANATLKRCLQMAQKMTGSSYYGGETARFHEFSPYHTIDQRRLFDGLREEQEALILLYSPKDHRLLFANHQTKNLLGWSSDKFVQDFFTIIQTSLGEWKEAIEYLNSHLESQARLLVKTKHGEELLMHCQLGQISTGLFRHYIIGVLHPLT